MLLAHAGRINLFIMYTTCLSGKKIYLKLNFKALVISNQGTGRTTNHGMLKLEQNKKKTRSTRKYTKKVHGFF